LPRFALNLKPPNLSAFLVAEVTVVSNLNQPHIIFLNKMLFLFQNKTMCGEENITSPLTSGTVIKWVIS
jgi:hypothetical protein